MFDRRNERSSVNSFSQTKHLSVRIQTRILLIPPNEFLRVEAKLDFLALDNFHFDRMSCFYFAGVKKDRGPLIWTERKKGLCKCKRIEIDLVFPHRLFVWPCVWECWINITHVLLGVSRCLTSGSVTWSMELFARYIEFITCAHRIRQQSQWHKSCTLL